VGWIHAGWIAAEVVQHQAIWNRANQRFICKAVNENVASILTSEVPVSAAYP